MDQSKKCNGFSECAIINFGDTSDEAGCGMKQITDLNLLIFSRKILTIHLNDN